MRPIFTAKLSNKNKSKSSSNSSGNKSGNNRIKKKTEEKSTKAGTSPEKNHQKKKAPHHTTPTTEAPTPETAAPVGKHRRKAEVGSSVDGSVPTGSISTDQHADRIISSGRYRRQDHISMLRMLWEAPRIWSPI